MYRRDTTGLKSSSRSDPVCACNGSGVILSGRPLLASAACGMSFWTVLIGLDRIETMILYSTTDTDGVRRASIRCFHSMTYYQHDDLT